MTADDVVFLLDVDNTLLDNDAFLADLQRHLEDAFGRAHSDRYWQIYEMLRDETGYADYLGALQRFRCEVEHDATDDHRLLRMSEFLIEYPFAERLYPRALDVIAHLTNHGRTVIVTDGDIVYQPRKLRRSGLWDAVQGRVLIYVHKDHRQDAIERLYPARHYVMVDDKLRILTAMKDAWGERVTTVFPRQGHYALDPEAAAQNPAPDLTIGHIGDLVDADASTLRIPT